MDFRGFLPPLNSALLEKVSKNRVLQEIFEFHVKVAVLKKKYFRFILIFRSFSRYPLQSFAPNPGAEGFPLLSGLKIESVFLDLDAKFELLYRYKKRI